MTTWSIERKTLAALIVALTTLTIMSMVGLRAIYEHADSSNRLAKAQQRLDGIYKLHGAVHDLVASQDAFLVTGNPAQLQERNKALERLQLSQASLQELMRINPGQQKRFAEVQRFIGEQVHLLDEALAEYSATHSLPSGPAGPRAHFQEAMNKFNLALGAIVNSEEQLIAHIRLLDNRSAQTLYIAQGIVLALSFAILVGLAMRIRTGLNQRTHTENLLREANGFLESLIENIPAMVFVKDAKDHKFVRLNKAGENLLGRTREEMIGKSDRDFFPASQADFFISKDKEVLAQDRVIDIQEEEIETRNMGKRVLHTRKVPVKGADGTPSLLVGISMDITERKKAERHIMTLNAELEHNAKLLKASNQELESFCYSVSHDLRAPLRTIDGFAQMLEDECGPQLHGSGLRYLHTIRSGSQRMGKLIDDLLAFSKVGRQPVVSSTLDMSMLAAKAAEVAAFGCNPPPQISIQKLPPARGDESMLYRVWLNLIDNACKYSARTARPSIKISASVDAQQVIYCVQDNGVGFDMAYYDKLFGVFQRLHAEEGYTGTGVGLAIVDRIVARHGGRVWAESRPNQGASFYFSLPIEASLRHEAAA